MSATFSMGRSGANKAATSSMGHNEAATSSIGHSRVNEASTFSMGHNDAATSSMGHSRANEARPQSLPTDSDEPGMTYIVQKECYSSFVYSIKVKYCRKF